ncbi:hypothetical protein B0H14DRAFT_2461105 [Mycena olivaceomarginata]|nr:hypothetical protein B0H14DRAFT_2476124 [Mycena olivaceomarginata]KAJ7808336.1 hypothetical protein B0H14DRAFT_2461105 [Mycena olivaceomarginata]
MEADDDETKVKRAGRLFVLNYGLWVKGNARIFDIDIDPAYDEKKRFDTAANKIQGQLREIESILPKVDSKRRKSWIARMFMAGVTSQRPNTSTRMRRTAGAAIFDCSPADLLVPEDRLKQFRDQIGWYVDDAGSGAYSSLDVPILHADWAGEYDFKTCFLNPCLMRVRETTTLYIALIRGPSAATTQLKHDKAKAGSEVILSIGKCENMEHIFIMDHTEPGAIAGSAVLAIWALSADTSLRDRGDRTSIDYGARFDQYLEILLVGLREKSESILNIFKEWDRVVFPNSESGYAGTIQSGPGDGGNQRALEALRAEKQAAAEGDTH